ncbi:MAG: hypothetical protein JO209_08375 [Acidisphaera sp.]|nr:hypothetical protein [Acidisphaera sp.]
MRRTAGTIAAALLLAMLIVPHGGGRARAQGAQPPHAWLFGTWTGGLFPAPSGLSGEACLSQPVVIFTRDLVMRAVLTDQFYTQRLITTARATAGGFEFVFQAAATGAESNGLFGLSAPPPPAGFGCDGPDVLHVQRRGDNEIVFPGCADFPNPLIRCPSR